MARTKAPASRQAPPADPALTPITAFDGARDAATPDERLREVRSRARAFRDAMMAGPAVRYLRSFGLVHVPYPVRYGLRDACPLPAPLLHIVNRVFIVQVDSDAGLKTVLVSPSDVEADAETPFFKRLGGIRGPLAPYAKKILAPVLSSVEASVAEAGLRPEDIDYITYDHLHTQDVRRWLGTHGGRGYFPNAKLLVMRREWDAAQGLLPPQRDWYCPDGIAGVDPERIVLLDSDVMVGRGLALVRTPGHTMGNHSIVTRAGDGIYVTSENGIAPDSYAPLESRIPGLRRYARDTGMEVVLNGNTLEGGLDQYISMVMEKEIAGPAAANPAFPSMLCSSELTAWWACPGIAPTFAFGDVCFGNPSRGEAAA
jgi:glyoxylase-like metal-dependent hydrolase (beta-lactamase superfamily II)